MGRSKQDRHVVLFLAYGSGVMRSWHSCHLGSVATKPHSCPKPRNALEMPQTAELLF